MKRPRMSSVDWALVAYAVIFIIGIVWTVYYFTGSCDVLERLPMKDAPQRCLR